MLRKNSKINKNKERKFRKSFSFGNEALFFYFSNDAGFTGVCCTQTL